VTSESRNWNNHLFIVFILSEDFLETVRQAKELLLLTNLALQNDWLNIKILKCLSHQFFCCGALTNLEISATRIHISFAHKPSWSLTVSSKMLHWIGSSGRIISSFVVAAHGFRKHVFFFLRVCVVDEFGVVIIVSSWLHIWLINKSSKVLGNVYMSILGQKLLSWLQ